MKEKITIIDYGTGNLSSVENAFKYLGKKPIITSNPEKLQEADKIVLPGVGSFGYAMKRLKEKRLLPAIKNAIREEKPFLGICLGLQLLFDESEESNMAKGLGIFKGKVVRFRQGKVPQIGWNKVIPIKKPFQEGYYYFINSYYAVPEEAEIISGKTNYYCDFTSVIKFENITAVQFHPEKSGIAGINFLKRWLKC